MAEAIVFGPGYSTFTRSILLALEEKGAAYELKPVDILAGENQAPEYLARQPFGKVPAFEHNGFAIYETEPILSYIDESYDGPALQPDDCQARARMRQVIGVIDNYAYSPMIGDIVINRMVKPLLGAEPDEAVISEAAPKARTAAEALDRLIGDQDYVAGSNLSLADLHLAPVIDYFSQTPEGAVIMADTPNLSRWWANIKDRDCVVKTRPSLG